MSNLPIRNTASTAFRHAHLGTRTCSNQPSKPHVKERGRPIPKLDSNFVICESEELFSQAIVLLLLPLLGQKFFDSSSANNEGGPIAPDAVDSVGLSDGLRVPV
jgi:hypothetical protein